MQTLPILFGYNISGIGNSSIPLVFGEEWNKRGLSTLLYSPSRDSKFNFKWLKPALAGLKKRFVYNFGSAATPKILAENTLLKHEEASQFVYLWAGLSLDVFERLHNNGCKIILERINCHQATAKDILDRAYAACSIVPQHPITQSTIDIERRKLEMADAIFCPSPMVFKSLVDNGVDPKKLMLTSYGWSPERFPQAASVAAASARVQFLFVGSICIRKGIALLIEAWEKADVNGDLVFCGSMEEAVREKYGYFFAREDVTYIPYTADISKYYNSSDVFLFPTLEEGGPMVTYEAMAHSSVPLVSTMGAGSIVEHKKNGLILEHDADVWSAAIMAIAANENKRLELSRAAQVRAAKFTWKKVAERRADQLLRRYPTIWQ